MKLKRLAIIALSLAGCLMASAQRYCNPLPMVVGNGGNAGGDCSVFQEGGKWYMACTGGGIWVSEDFLDWEFHQVEVEGGIPVAPDIAKFNGKFYMTGNTEEVRVADNPLGPYKVLGTFHNTGPVADGWNRGFDCKIYVDDDNQPYLFWPGYGISGIFGVRLDPNDLTRFAEKPTHLISFNPMHTWEHYGDANEYSNVGWIEGPWVIKRNGIYYLEYSASGTQWKSYAQGYYTAPNPLGPYSYAPNNPLTRNTEGLVTGTGHGSIVKGPDGEWWQFYTIVFSTPTGGRRIGMDRITFDDEGFMSCKITDTPQRAPLAPVRKDARPSIPVTINKMADIAALKDFSSEREGFYASYGIDNYSGTIWRPQADDAQPYMTLDLSPATRFDVVEHFSIDGLRILFSSSRRAPGAPAAASLPVYKYKLEASQDGKTFFTVLDRMGNTIPRDTIYEDFKPVNCRFIRLTITDWPKSSPLGIIDFTVFGYPDGWDSPEVASPAFANSNLPTDHEYQAATGGNAAW